MGDDSSPPPAPVGPVTVWQPDAVRPPEFVRRTFRGFPPNVRTVLLHARGDYAPWEEGYHAAAPVTGPGEVVGPPDFVGIGTQKAGTSWWYELVSEHPGVFDRPDLPKERHALSRFVTEPFGPAQVEEFHRWFPRTPGTITGEWTPEYLVYPWVAPLLAEAAPDARLLVLVREPVDRFRSGLTFRLSMGAPDTSATVADAVRQGFTARWLRRYLQYFPTDRVLVQQYERCRADPEGELARTYAFLGLDPHRPADVRREVNVSTRAKLPLDPGAEAALVDLYRADVADLAGLVPDLDLGLWPRFADVGSAR